MIPQHIKSKMIEAGVEFAETEDAVKAVMRIATDPSVNGRSLGVLSRDRAPQGYIDLDSDDYREGDFIYPMEQLALSIKFCVGRAAVDKNIDLSQMPYFCHVGLCINVFEWMGCMQLWLPLIPPLNRVKHASASTEMMS
ncbi:hypothetical protein FJTKL_05594 [Diaporthe vaccinii]|uniref:Uncharacterized protein n=1 Tax=Diaporthe vaccinii TaxID=105482 RepID=A0ABR4DV40_9PEZI